MLWASNQNIKYMNLFMYFEKIVETIRIENLNLKYLDKILGLDSKPKIWSRNFRFRF